jgi:hypothetical protein
MLVTIFNLARLLILALLGLSVVWLARAKGFKPGHRAIMQ